MVYFLRQRQVPTTGQENLIAFEEAELLVPTRQQHNHFSVRNLIRPKCILAGLNAGVISGLFLGSYLPWKEIDLAAIRNKHNWLELTNDFLWRNKLFYVHKYAIHILLQDLILTKIPEIIDNKFSVLNLDSLNLTTVKIIRALFTAAIITGSECMISGHTNMHIITTLNLINSVAYEFGGFETLLISDALTVATLITDIAFFK